MPSVLGRTSSRTDLRLWRDLSPPQLFAGSFLLLIIGGTLGLRLVPVFYVDGTPLGWIDALFTATSAVCVTGLIVVDTATHFTFAGQAFLLLLIQLGGLGMITITTLIILSLGGRLSLRAEAVTTGMAGALPEIRPRRLTRDVVLFTLAFEALGAAILFAAFSPHLPASEALWHAVFQAVSAFCNAGFSTFSDSLEAWAGQPFVIGSVMVLIVLGGIGFLTLEEVATRFRTRGGSVPFRLSLHTRLVLASSAILLAGGWVLYAWMEWGGVLGEMGLMDRLGNALFMSVTARTAGFNTVVYAEASEATNFLTILLMSVGGSPGSTAGGLKTTTFALIALLAWSRMRGRLAVSAWSRTIPDETVQRAVGLFAVAFACMALATLLMTTLEGPRAQGERFIWVLFEVTSAFNTVGLSLGSTGELSPLSRLLTVVLMFIGRVGPLSFAAALALRARRRVHRYRFAHEDVTVG